MKLLTPSEFFKLVWPAPLLTNETLELRVINRNTQRVRRHFTTSIQEFLKLASRYGDEEVYFGVSTRYGPHGKKQNCYRVQTLWADLDNRRFSDCNFSIRPDIGVDSGGGSHVYWLLKNPYLVTDERWKEVEARNRAICKELKADNAAIDVSRILRVPNFLNHKYNPPKFVRAYQL